MLQCYYILFKPQNELINSLFLVSMKAQDLFKALSDKAGITYDDKDLVAFLSANPSLEIPDSLANSFVANLMNEKEAKLHAGLNSHFKQNTLAGVDKKISDLLAELQVEDSVKNEILGEKNTYEKVALTVKKIQALEKAKAQAGTGDKAALQKEIDRLNGEFTALTDKHKNEIKSLQDAKENEILQYAIDAHLSSMNYANKEVPKEANVATAKYLLQKSLEDKKVKVVRENNSLKLIRNDESALPYTENHKEIPFNAFTDSILSTNKLLKVGNPPNTPVKPTPVGTTPVQIDPEIASHYQEQIAVFSNGH